MRVTDVKVLEAIATHLKVEVYQIKSASELAQVWSVVVFGKRARFVSKRQVLARVKSIKSIFWTVKAETRRQEGKKWVARIDGQCPTYGFKRTFLSAKEIEWGKFGMRVAKFEILEPGFYQDSDGDYFKVSVIGDELDADICSKLEVSSHFNLVKV